MPLRLRLPAALRAGLTMSRRFGVGALVLCAGLAMGPPRPTIAAEITPDERQQIETVVHDYLMKNPDVLIEALQAAKDKMESENREKAAKALGDRRDELLNDPETPIGGNPKGDVSLVEFFDYRCPYCKQVEQSLEQLVAEDHQLRFVYKELPVLGPDSTIAARVALASRKQGKYEAFHSAMMQTKGQIGESVIFEVAGSVGLDVKRLKEDMAAPEIDKTLKANLELADALDIKGTPGFVIGKEIVPGAVDISTLRQYVADARNAEK
jgi:protein-disulfide isomerase